MAIKLKIQGEPDEIEAFFGHVSECEALELVYRSNISKRAEHHKWGSAIATVVPEVADDVEADVTIYEGKKQKAQTKAGFIYLMPAYGAEGLLGYKIGKTIRPQSRRRTFGVKLGFAVKFLALISTTDHTKLETELHRMFAEKRQGYSEFFNLTSDDAAKIIGMMSPDDEKLLKEVNRD
jgi:hypothetical protein